MSSHIYHLKKGEKLQVPANPLLLVWADLFLPHLLLLCCYWKQVKGPIPKLAYSKNMKKHLGMLAGGTGTCYTLLTST